MTFVLQALNGHFPAEGLVMFGYKENSEVPLNKPGLLWVMALIGLAGGGQSLHAQGTTAELRGVVKDPTANVVPGAEVRVQNLDTGLSRTVRTADGGSYSFLGLRPGRYSVYVEASGFRPALTKEIVLNVGQKAELSFRLEVSPIMEAIEVLSKTQMLEARRTSVSTTIVERLIRSLPSQSRDALNFTLLDSAATRENQASLPPIPATGFNIDGQQGRTITVTIDGVDAIDNTINGARITIPQDTVQEFEVLKSGYEAEHGKSSSGVINVVSKQGGNQLEGDVFALLRSRHVSATNAFAGEPDPGDTNTQAGFTLGGPLQRSRTFFFTGFDTTQENSTGFSTVGLDGFGLVEVANSYGMGSLLLTRAQAEFTRSTPASLAVPYSLLADRASHVALDGNLPGGPRNFGLIPNPLPASFRGLKGETGNYKTTYDSYVHSSRLDHLFGTHALFLRFGLSSSDAYGRPSNSQAQTDTQNAFSRTNNLFVRDLAITAQISSSIGSTWLNEARFQFGRRGLGLRANSSNVAVEVPGVASIGAEPFAPADRIEKRWQVSSNLSHLRASHTYKTGIDFNYIPAVASFPLNQSGLYAFPTTLPVDFPFISAVLGPQLTSALQRVGAPGFSAAQLYGMGLPESFVQQFGGAASSDGTLPELYTGSVFSRFLESDCQFSAELWHALRL